MNGALRAAVAGAAMLLAALPGVGHAADQRGRYAVRGMGGSTCTSALKTLATPGDANALIGWLLGYATAVNRLQGDTFDVIPSGDGADLARVFAVVCQKQPDLAVEAAVQRAIASLAPLRLRQESPLVAVGTAPATVQLRQETLVRVQAVLIGRKLLAGPADGKSSPALVAALRKFQVAEKLQPTGLPDLQTLARALLPPATSRPAG